MDERTDELPRPRGPRGLRDPGEWHRDYPDRRIAGVCQSLARNLEISVSAVRIAFALLALFHGFGVWLYAILWGLLPARPGEPSALDRWIRAGRRFLAGDPEEMQP
jgi:phage shock protein PspC (stress-responsive transcriptional regulator)